MRKCLKNHIMKLAEYRYGAERFTRVYFGICSWN